MVIITSPAYLIKMTKSSCQIGSKIDNVWFILFVYIVYFKAKSSFSLHPGLYTNYSFKAEAVILKEHFGIFRNVYLLSEFYESNLSDEYEATARSCYFSLAQTLGKMSNKWSFLVLLLDLLRKFYDVSRWQDFLL